MNPNHTAAYRALEQAQQARKARDKRLARQYAEQAARLAPEIEDVWLMMAALASPRASVVFMEKALQINPHSERVRQGMHWAVERLRKEPVRKQVYAAIAAQPVLVKKPVTGSRLYYGAALLTVACLVAIWAVWNATPAAASFINSSLFISEVNAAPEWAPVGIPKPTYTPTSRPTQTPTLAPSATAIFIDIPTETTTLVATELPTETATLIASEPPTEPPTEIATLASSDTPTLTPTDIASLTPLAIASPLGTDITEEASPTPLPTDTDVPGVPTRAIPPPAQNHGGKGGVRWVDVDLTHQMVYAYEGDMVVNSFLVSTGTWLHPTVTGQYHIYIKYRYKDMSGPGYFLPNVPWTMFFYQGYALHGTYWHSNFGTPMSHGCVNLSIPDAEWLYNWASVGTLVNVHY